MNQALWGLNASRIRSLLAIQKYLFFRSSREILFVVGHRPTKLIPPHSGRK